MCADAFGKSILIALAVIASALLVSNLFGPGAIQTSAEPLQGPMAEEPLSEEPFGGADDVRFAESLGLAIVDREEWPMQSAVSEGGSPHGAFVKLYYNTVRIAGENYHVIVKDNYGGEDATLEAVASDPDGFFGAATVMVQRGEGYDPQDGNWFYVKYLPDGSIDLNAMGVPLAGRVGKGADSGCLPCHRAAEGEDYLFTND